ncbi:hypothetical protein HID58_024717, partial [Brassica napus]
YGSFFNHYSYRSTAHCDDGLSCDLLQPLPSQLLRAFIMGLLTKLLLQPPLPYNTSSNLPDAAPPQNAETIDQSPTQLVPSLGAWSKRLIFQFCPPNTPPESSTPHNYIWPHRRIFVKRSSSLAAKSSSFEVAASITKGRRFASISMGYKGEPGFKEFVLPTFILDGTPEIIPTKVLQLGPENVGEYVPGESIKANDITSELPYQASDPNSGKEFGPHKTVLIPQYFPFQFGKPGASSTNVNCSTNYYRFFVFSGSYYSIYVAISHKESSTIFVLDAKFTLSSTLSGSSSAHTSPPLWTMFHQNYHE